MAIDKGKIDAGQGGKRGHSNMAHWVYSHELKEASRKARPADAFPKGAVSDRSRDRARSG